MLDKSRYLAGEMLEKFKVFERNFFNSVNFLFYNTIQRQRKKDTDKVKEELL